MNRSPQRLLALAAAFLLAACGTGKDGDDAPEPKAAVSGLVDGVKPLQLEIGAATLDLPKDALAVGTEVTLGASADVAPAEALTRVSKGFALSATTQGVAATALAKGAYLKATGLTLAAADQNVCVRAELTGGRLVVWPRSMLKLVDPAGGAVAFSTRYTGNFQITTCPDLAAADVMNADGYALMKQPSAGELAGVSACDLRRAAADEGPAKSRCRVYYGRDYLTASNLEAAATACAVKRSAL